MQRTGRRVAAAMAAGLVVQLSLPLLGARTGVVLDNVLLAVIGLVTAVGHARQTRLSRGQRRTAWALACAAAGLWSLSSGIDTVAALWTLDTALDEMVAVAAAIASLVALVLLGTADRVGRAVRLRRGIDVATVAGALFFLAWEFVLAPASAGLPRATAAMIILVLLPEIVGAGYALVLLSRSLSHRGDEALSLLAAGLLGFAATMLLAVHNLVHGLPWYATGVGAGYVIAGLLTALASAAPLPSGTFAEQTDNEEGRWALLPYVPVGLAFAAAAWRYVQSGNVTAVLFWLLLATSALVLVRQFLSMRTTQKLTDDLRAQRAELAYQASHDALTGLVNRTAFQQRAAAVVAGAGPGGLTGVLVIDLDGFKTVNDTLGHAAGDALLVGVAARLRSAVRAGDTVARLGGDEFVVLLPGLQYAGEVDDVGNRVLQHLTEPVDVGSGALAARASVGATVGAGAACDPLDLVKQADIALYEAKAAGKGTVRRYVPAQPAATVAPG
jgi:diguanylate cyclase (GGDEF)-like protein